MNKYIQKDFYLPLDETIKFDLTITYKDLRYEPNMIPVNFDYHLDKEDVEYLLKTIADTNNLKTEGNIFNFMYAIIMDEDYIIRYLDDFLYRSKNKPVKDKLLDFCKDKALKDFKAAFEYWVDDDEDLEKYYETEDLT